MATLLCYLAFLSYAVALPNSPPNSDSTALSADGSTVVHAIVSESPAFDTNYRSTVEIIWSCLSVIFASSWLCVHPNATGYDTTMWQRLGERFRLFAIAVFAPEIMAVFAFYQWIGCRELHQKFRERALGEELKIPLQLNSGVSETPGGSESVLQRFWTSLSWPSLRTLAGTISPYRRDAKETAWTYSHAHFVQMGGVVFRDDNGNLGFKSPEDWGNDDLQKFFAMKLPEAAITDKSKAGALAKTLVVARVLWFLIQTIARAVQGLPIALLEVASLAFIAFNLAMYVFWWDKPLDVEYPLEIPGIPGEGDHSRSRDLRIVMFVLLGWLDAVPIDGGILAFIPLASV